LRSNDLNNLPQLPNGDNVATFSTAATTPSTNSLCMENGVCFNGFNNIGYITQVRYPDDIW
jgi:hypothetical protein